MGIDKLLCLITGPSGSGKTCIALELQKRFSMVSTTSVTRIKNTEGGIPKKSLSSSNNLDATRPVSVAVIHQDHYFNKSFLPYKERVDDSYESDSGIDWDGLLADAEFQLKEASRNNDGGSEGCNGNNNHDDCVKIVIVEGHLLGAVAARFRRRFFVRDNVAILAVLVTNCSQETCKVRRLERKKDRSEDERKELSSYIDVFVWSSFLSYGVDAMIALRREFVGAATTSTTKGTDQDVRDSKLFQPAARESNKSVAVLLEIDNSEGSSLEVNVDEISNRIHTILLC